MADSRMLEIQNDPRFLEMRKKKNKPIINDERFNKMYTDPNFEKKCHISQRRK